VSTQASTTTHQWPRTITATAGAAAALATAGLVALTADAFAALAHTVPRGTCTLGGTVAMQLQHSDRGLLEAGFEVDQVKVGSVWRVHLVHNGVTYFTGRRAAAAPDGTFSVDRVLTDRPGTDTVTGRARNTITGNTCTVAAHI